VFTSPLFIYLAHKEGVAQIVAEIGVIPLTIAILIFSIISLFETCGIIAISTLSSNGQRNQ